MRRKLPFSILLTFLLLSTLSLTLFLLRTTRSLEIPRSTLESPLKVYLSPLPKSVKYGHLLYLYWHNCSADTRIPSDPDHPTQAIDPQSYPENPLIKQYSAEYWITADLMTPQEMRGTSYAQTVGEAEDADVVFVPFFATLSAEMELAKGKGSFRRKEGNQDYQRQKEVVDFVTHTHAWNRSGGRDHVFVLTGCVKP